LLSDNPTKIKLSFDLIGYYASIVSQNKRIEFITSSHKCRQK